MAKRKIAILGGGVGSLSAAFQLTESANWQNDYEITVYQMGWRLGGKGASGRSSEPSAQIEEHGLHVWFGFYNNAFRMIRKVYDEAAPLMPGSPFQKWTDAFRQQISATLMEFVGGEWKPWTVVLPILPGQPGDSSVFEEAAGPASPWTHVRNIIGWIRERYLSLLPQLPNRSVDPQSRSALAVAVQNLPSPARLLIEPLLDLVSFTPGLLLELAERLTALFPPEASDAFSTVCNFILQLLQFFLQSWIEPSTSAGDEIRRAAIAFDIGIAAVRGMIASGVILNGFDVINDWDYAEWLGHYGSKYADSVLIRNLYDGCFAYVDGDPKRPNFEAGTALRGHLRLLFDYRGSVIWKMNAGMGDTIFAPLYEVLKKRGVKFRFFRRVKNLHLSADRKTIDKITLDVQANLAGADYDPLVKINGLSCWPNQPRYEQIANGDILRNYNLESWYTEWHDRIGEEALLRSNDDFDDVILGIPVGALPYVCDELITANASWRSMVTKVATVQTQALQLWLHKSAQDLGWASGATLPPNQAPFSCGYVEPFDTYSDMTHLIPRENWTAGDNVQSIAYFCNAFPHDPNIPPPFTAPGFPAAQLARVGQLADQFLARDVSRLWPNGGTIANPRALDPNLIRKDYRRANIDPPERYVLSTVGTTQYRLDPGNSQFTNLYLAGDWTRNGLNGGCVEAAVTSGMAAAQSISGASQKLFGFSDDIRFDLARDPAPSGGTGAQIRKFWQDQAAAKLPPESQVLARNAAVTAAYGGLYNTERALFKWAGLASYASHRVGLLLLAYKFVDVGDGVQILDEVTGVPVAQNLARDLNLIRQMNNAVYQDIAWTHLAYQARGLGEVLAGLEGLPDHQKIASGFTQIEKGRQLFLDPHSASEAASLIWAGNRDLLYHEQNFVLQPGYDQMDLGFKSVLSFATSMDFNVTIVGYDPSFVTFFTMFMSTEGIAILLRTGSLPRLSNFEQRWFWVDRAILPLWKRVDGGSSDEIIAHGFSVIVKEVERANLLRSLWPFEKRPG